MPSTVRTPTPPAQSRISASAAGDRTTSMSLACASLSEVGEALTAAPLDIMAPPSNAGPLKRLAAGNGQYVTPHTVISRSRFRAVPGEATAKGGGYRGGRTRPRHDHDRHRGRPGVRGRRSARPAGTRRRSCHLLGPGDQVGPAARSASQPASRAAELHRSAGEYAGHRDAIWLVGEVRPGTHSGRSSRCRCRWSGGHPSPRPPSGGSCDCAVISPTPAASQWNSR